MNNNEDVLVKPFTIERVCEPRLDVTQLTFHDVDTTESVYSRVLVQLKNASLPDVIYDPNGPKMSLIYTQLINTSGDHLPNPPDKEPSSPTPSPHPSAPVPSPQAGSPSPQRPPEHVSWDLFLMLKYRQDWVPSGYGLGELLFAISLMPNEELTLETKTWETSKTQQDTEDTTDQRNVSDIKSSSSNTNESTTEDQTKTHEYVDAKAGYSGFGFDAEVKAGWSSDVSDMQKNFERNVQDNSRQTTNEYRATHKVKMSVSREEGSESKTTRKIRNINQAHTLNANYFEVLREYTVTLRLYEVTLVLLSAEPDLLEDTGHSSWWEEQPHSIRLGQMIRWSQSATWVQAFIDVYGKSPIKLIRERWSDPLYHAALKAVDVTNTTDSSAKITDEDRKAFQNTMLQYVRPSPGWIEPDGTGKLRWAYEVVPGQENNVLNYLYQFLPYSVQQMLARTDAAEVDRTTAYQAVVSWFKQATVPNYRTQVLREITASSQVPSLLALGTTLSLKLEPSEEVLVSGPFYGKTIGPEFEEAVSEWVQGITDEFQSLKPQDEDRGDIKGAWKTTLPTHGVYADLALGVCSGAEDYYEIQRQFDLELKKLEIEKLKLELQLLQQGKSLDSVVIENPTDNTTIKLDIGVPKTPATVEIKQ